MMGMAMMTIPEPPLPPLTPWGPAGLFCDPPPPPPVFSTPACGASVNG
jgi:hypothetical protein